MKDDWVGEDTINETSASAAIGPDQEWRRVKLLGRAAALDACLVDMLMLIETNQLVRNTMADSQPDWLLRMVKFTAILKRAQELTTSTPTPTIVQREVERLPDVALLENADVLAVLQKYAPQQTNLIGIQAVSQITNALNVVLEDSAK